MVAADDWVVDRLVEAACAARYQGATVRKIGRRAYHVLRELEAQAA